MRYPGLDFLRAIAILWVLFFHAGFAGLNPPLPWVGRTGWMAVDLFFVLSGFLIASQLFHALGENKPAPIRTFYARRFLRIFPAYCVVVVIYALLPSWRESPGMQPAWQFLTFTENLLVDYEHHQAFSHAWSLCVEEHFYLLFPWIALAAVRWASFRSVVIFAGVVLGGGVGLRWWLWHSVLQDGAVVQAQGWRFIETLYYPTYARLDGLLVGVMLAALRYHRPVWWEALGRRAWIPLAVGTGLCVGGIVIARHRYTFGAAIVGYPLLAMGFGALLIAFASPASWTGRMAIPGVRLLATITFSVYLSHKMVWHLLQTRLPDFAEPGSALSFVGYMAAALAGGGVIYLLIERPFLVIRERFAQRKARPDVQPALGNVLKPD